MKASSRISIFDNRHITFLFSSGTEFGMNSVGQGALNKKEDRLSRLPFRFLIYWPLKAKWFCKEYDQNHNKGVNTEGLDHGKTDDQGSSNLS